MSDHRDPKPDTRPAWLRAWHVCATCGAWHVRSRARSHFLRAKSLGECHALALADLGGAWVPLRWSHERCELWQPR